MLKPHCKFDIDWIGFPKTHRRVKGVYLIQHCYIGASIHIRNRILSHLHGIKRLKIIKSYKDKYLFDCILTSKPVKVYLLSNNPLEEKKWQEYYFGKHDNITYDIIPEYKSLIDKSVNFNKTYFNN